MKGVAGVVMTATSKATATAIDAGSDNDTITSDGTLSADAESNTVSVGLALSGQGVSLALDAVWDGGSKSNATASGISAGDGTDTVVNGGDMNITADAFVNSDTISANYQGVAGSAVSSTATAFASGIDGGSNPDATDQNGDKLLETITNDGALTVNATSSAVSVGVSISGQGVALALDAVWDGGSKSTAGAVGLSGGEGADAISSHAKLDVGADAFVNSDTIAGNFMGVAGAVVSSTATASAIGIAGDCRPIQDAVCAGGDDTVDNYDEIDADAKSAGRVGERRHQRHRPGAGSRCACGTAALTPTARPSAWTAALSTTC